MVNKIKYFTLTLLTLGNILITSSDQSPEPKNDIIIPGDFQHNEKQLDLDQLRYRPEVAAHDDNQIHSEEEKSYFTTKNTLLTGGALAAAAGAFYLYRNNQQPTDFVNMSHDQIQAFINQHGNTDLNRTLAVDPVQALKASGVIVGMIGATIGTSVLYMKIRNHFQAPLEKRIADLEQRVTRTNYQNHHFEERIIEIATRSNEHDQELSRFAQEHNRDREAMRQIRDRSNDQDQRLAGQRSLLAKIIDRSDNQDKLIDETRGQLNNVIMHVQKFEEKR